MGPWAVSCNKREKTKIKPETDKLFPLYVSLDIHYEIILFFYMKDVPSEEIYISSYCYHFFQSYIHGNDVNKMSCRYNYKVIQSSKAQSGFLLK